MMPGYQNHAERRFIKIMKLRKIRTEYKKYMNSIPVQGNTRYNAKKFLKTYYSSSNKTPKIGTTTATNEIPITTIINTNHQDFTVNEDILSFESDIDPVTLAAAAAAAPYCPPVDQQAAVAFAADAVDQNISASSPVVVVVVVPDTIQDSSSSPSSSSQQQLSEITLFSNQLVQDQQRYKQRVVQRLDLRRVVRPTYKRKMKSKGSSNKSFYSNAIKFRKVYYYNSNKIVSSNNHSDLSSASAMAEIHLSKYTEPFITQQDHILSTAHSIEEEEEAEEVPVDSILSFITEVNEVTMDFAIINPFNMGQYSMNESASTKPNVEQEMDRVIDDSNKEADIVVNQATISQVTVEFVENVDEKFGANEPEFEPSLMMDAPERCMIEKNGLIEGAIDQESVAFITTATAQVDTIHSKVERSSTNPPAEESFEEVVSIEQMLTDLAITSYDQSKLEIGPIEEEMNRIKAISIKERISLATPPSSIIGVLYEEKVLIVTPPQSVTNFTTTTIVTVEEEKNSPSLIKEGKKNIFSRMFKNKAGTLVPKKMKKMKTTKVWKRLFDSSDDFNKQKVK